jgi:diguanylate cyclase (GGDEF)-like protein
MTAPFRINPALDLAPVALPETVGLPDAVAMPAVSQFAGVVELIKTVFSVPAVQVSLAGGGASARGGCYQAFLETPLLREGERIGALRILDVAERRFDERDCLLLEGFARLVVEQVDLWAEASRDVLTGAMTRRAFMDHLAKAFAARQRQHGQSALILFDLDHFKRINDTRGHAAGDAVLRATARTVLRELRVEDSFGRVGGEEFAVLLNHVDLATAVEVAERLRRAIAAMAVPGQPDLAVSASFGVVALTDATPSAEALMEGADVALYAAKAGGRNRVETGACAPALVN